MRSNLWLCGDCRHQASVIAGTIFQDSHLPLTTWFRAMWYVTSQKNGMSALGLQRVLGLGSYKTAWSLLHKLRRAMVRPGRDRLRGVVEVDETLGQSGNRRRRSVDSRQVSHHRSGRRGWPGHWSHPFAAYPRFQSSESAWVYCRGGRTGQHRPNRRLARLPGFRRICSRPAGTAESRGQASSAASASGSLTAQAVVAGNSSRRDPTGTSGRLPQRIHVPFQPAQVRLTRQAVLSADTTGSSSRTSNIRFAEA